RYAGDIVVELSGGPAGGGKFIGEKGSVTIDRGKCSSDPPEIAKEPIASGEVHLYKSDNHMKNWLDCIKSRQRPV
ncbi:MAG: gfo/Idh/MocA family oxidoreductase, partial [Thermoguttaceae bacterium]|nr:gfo/Idh/MocA family oxidoreductase [Thermoguttaceae bacterium]